jgi:hypothetical protein
LKYSPFTTVEKTATIVRNKLNIFEDIDGIEFVRKESNKQQATSDQNKEILEK